MAGYNMFSAINSTAPPKLQIELPVRQLIERVFKDSEEQRTAALSVALQFTNCMRAIHPTMLEPEIRGDTCFITLVVRQEISYRQHLEPLYKLPVVIEIDLTLYADKVLVCIKFASTSENAKSLRDKMPLVSHTMQLDKFPTAAEMNNPPNVSPGNDMIKFTDQQWEQVKNAVLMLMSYSVTCPELDVLYNQSEDASLAEYPAFHILCLEDASNVQKPTPNAPIISGFSINSMQDLLDLPFVKDVFFFRVPPLYLYGLSLTVPRNRKARRREDEDEPPSKKS